MGLASLLNQLGAEHAPSPASLQALSNLAPSEVAELSKAFPALAVERRRGIVEWLADLAEDDVQLNFDAVFELCLDDTDPDVRRLAIEGLWENLDFRLVSRLLEILAGDSNTGVRAAAASALGKYELEAELDDRRARSAEPIDAALLAVFDDPGVPTVVRRRALESLSPRSIPEVQPAIRRALNEGSRDLRIAAIFAMGRSCDEQWLPTLLAELGSDDPELRYEAVTALGELEDQRALTSVVSCLNDEDATVRLAAVGALGKIGGEQAKSALQRLLRSDEEAIVEAAEEGLAEIGLGDRVFDLD